MLSSKKILIQTWSDNLWRMIAQCRYLKTHILISSFLPSFLPWPHPVGERRERDPKRNKALKKWRRSGSYMKNPLAQIFLTINFGSYRNLLLCIWKIHSVFWKRLHLSFLSLQPYALTTTWLLCWIGAGSGSSSCLCSLASS